MYIHIIYCYVYPNHVYEMYKHFIYKILFSYHGENMHIHRMSDVIWGSI